MLNLEKYFKKYIWDDERTPYFVPASRMTRRQADYELHAYAIFVGILFGANIMATAFYTKYAIVRFHAGVEMVALFTKVLMAVSVVSNLLCGLVGDRAGNKRLLELGLVTGVVAPLLAWMAPSAGWLIPVFALNQVAVTAWGIAQINYVLELCGPERAATYPAVAGLLIGPFRNSKDADIFAEDLASVRVDAFTWTNQPGQAIRKLPSE